MLALVLPKRPEPVAIDRDLAVPSLEEYAKLAESLDLDVGSLTPEAAVLKFMGAAGIPHYRVGDVDQFLDTISVQTKDWWCWMPLRSSDRAASTKDDSFDGHHVTYGLLATAWTFFALSIIGYALAAIFAFGVEWGWQIGLPLFAVATSSLCLGLSRYPEKFSVGYTENRAGLYRKRIPIEHLKHMVLLEAKFPDLSFFASEFSVVPDPFIMCTTFQGWRIVFGVWDEPGFGAV